MRKTVLIMLCAFLTFQLHAQDGEINYDNLRYITNVMPGSPVLLNPVSVDEGVPLNLSNPLIHNSTRTETGTVIGTSTYDLQTNSSSFNRIIAYESGEVYAAYTGAIDNTWGDRGTFYNSYDGSTWGAFPTERVETMRTGWPELIHINGKEMIICHQSPGTELIIVNERPTIGSGAWTETAMSQVVSGWWPRAATDGTDYLHVINANATGSTPNYFTLYSRSSDGGNTWDIVNARVNGIDTITGYNRMAGDAYNIVVKDSVVAFVSGATGSDYAVWKSTSNGDLGTWERTRLLDFPFDNFDGNIITDIDGDLVADQIETTDESHSILIDENGMIHTWTGAMLMIDDDATDGNWSYFPGVAGIFYWNESMGPDSLVYMDVLYDWDQSGDQFDGIGANPPGMGIGLTSAIDVTQDPETGNIYVVYSGAVENTDFFENPEDAAAQSFRDLFGMYTTDYGETWSQSINLTRQSDEFTESIYPSVNDLVVNGAVHLHYMRDEEPGHSLENTPDPVVTNQIVYSAFDLSAFEPYDPIADFDFNIISGLQVSFINTSDDASTYLWSFDDGLNSIDKNPVHVFPDTGVYNVCLTATIPYGDDEICKDVELRISGIEDVILTNSIKLFPSPATDLINLQIDGQKFNEAEVSVYNLTGQKVIKTLKTNFMIENRIKIDVSNLEAGMYFVKVQTDNAVGTKQFSVVR